MGSGIADATALAELARVSAKRVLLMDMEAAAERNGSVISSVLLGALCGSGVLPFRKEAFQAAIRGSGLAVDANLRAFEDANSITQRGESTFTSPAAGTPLPPLPAQARTAVAAGAAGAHSAPAGASPGCGPGRHAPDA